MEQLEGQPRRRARHMAQLEGQPRERAREEESDELEGLSSKCFSEAVQYLALNTTHLKDASRMLR